ncbi:hypothetical protein [Streptomyces sp. NBC_00842]|uniref:hypothetical protein n=1 Tax=Streptomyces sp. NBC_00842 TaxID=2975848 RepID=UPI002F916971|nr:hypothetical protein OH821_45210 [Streptomyces sp. NBC_00842]
MRRVLFDSNAIDPIAAIEGALEKLQAAVEAGDLDILYTHVTVDELVAIRDLERRGQLMLLMASIGRVVPTGAAVVDYSRLDFCRLGSDDDQAELEALRSHSTRHSRDALIAITARAEGCALVTNERRLTNRARERGVEVLTTQDLLAEFGTS